MIGISAVLPYKRRMILRITSIISLTCSVITIPASAQNKVIDSLKIALAKHPQQDDKRATTLFNLAVQYLQDNPIAAIVQFDEILSFKDKIKQNIVASTYRVKGIALVFKALYPAALNAINEALKIDKATNNNSGIAGDLGCMGMVYLSESKFPEALKYNLASLKIYEKINSKDGLEVANVLVNIGSIYNEMNQPDQAMANYQRSYQVYKKNKNLDAQAKVLANIGLAYSKKKNINEALKYSKLSLKLTDSIGEVSGSAREYGNLSAYYIKLGDSKLSLDYALKAIKLNKQIDNKKSLGINYQNAATAYFKLKDYNSAKMYGLQALDFGKNLNIIDLQRDATSGLSDVYESLKMPDSALLYYQQFYKLSDSISNDRKKTEIIRMSMQYDFDKKEFSYQQKQLLADGLLKQQGLQIALNKTQLEKNTQLRNLQKISLENEKLINRDREKQLILAKNNEKLNLSRVKELSQVQKLSKLELKQLWLYAILAFLGLGSLLIYLVNLHRIRKLRFKNTLQNQESLQNELQLKHQYQLTESELKAIRSQMNPHFIFNVLNSIEAYIMENDKKMASRLIQKFAALSRLILENSTKSLVTVDKELKALKLYTELEAMRYNNSFTYSFIVDEKIELKTTLLPPMLIQPLIENAILHGLMTNQYKDAHLEVVIKLKVNKLCTSVIDNGVGIGNTTNSIPKNPFKEKSMGIESIKERIEIISLQNPKNPATFQINSGLNDIGTIATVCLPAIYLTAEHYI